MSPPSREAICVLFALLIGAPALADIPQVQHVVIVFQENRTPDNLFHGLRNDLPKADISDKGIDSKGQTIELTAIPLANTYDLGHAHSAFKAMYDKGKMDGANLISCSPATGTKCPDHPQFRFVKPADVAPYFQIAIHYGFANRMFQSNQGPSFPAHQFILGGTSAPTATSESFVAENPTESKQNAGCIAPPSQRVRLITPDGQENNLIYPCFEHETLTDLLDHPPVGARAGLSWHYYSPMAGSIWTAPDAIRHMCRPSGTPPKCIGTDWKNGDVVLNSARVLADIQAGHLRAVSWVIPTGQESDHAKSNDGSGPSWVASVVNAIGSSKYWNNTVILIAWDDWGGWYDHVAPPIDPKYGYYEHGFRVPLLVVSAYTPAGYVSEKTHNFGSILKFIETAYDLPLIPPGTYVDSRSDDLSDFFDFTAKPRKFVAIPAPIGPDYFLHDPRKATDPDDD